MNADFDSVQLSSLLSEEELAQVNEAIEHVTSAEEEANVNKLFTWEEVAAKAAKYESERKQKLEEEQSNQEQLDDSDSEEEEDDNENPANEDQLNRKLLAIRNYQYPHWYSGPSYSWFCNRCRVRIIGDTDIHYTCLDCEDFDFCAACHDEAAEEHNAKYHKGTNWFTKIREPADQTWAFIANTKSLNEAYERAFETWSDRACLGQRRFLKSNKTSSSPSPAATTTTTTAAAVSSSSSSDQQLIVFGDEYEWYDYATVHTRYSNFASGLSHLQLKAGDFVGIFAANCVQWVLTDFACMRQRLTSVPIHTNLNLDDIQFIVMQAELKCVVTSYKLLPTLREVLARTPGHHVRVIVVMNDYTLDEQEEHVKTTVRQELSAASSVQVYLFSEVEALGAQHPIGAEATDMVEQQDDIFTVVYTSGSTGKPKGAVFPQQTWYEENVIESLQIFPRISFAYTQLSHMTARLICWMTMINGGRIGICHDSSTLFEDVKMIRPISMGLMPGVCTTVVQMYEQAVKKMQTENPELSLQKVRAVVRRDFEKNFLGGRCRILTTGAAPTTMKTRNFIRKLFKLPLQHGYGTTEAGSITIDAGLSKSVKIKLVDVPELNYFTTDKPYPRGELLVKTSRMILGYFKDEQATNQQFDADGYFRTGDIVEDRGQGKVVIIDRKKNVIKLAQGEFVSIASLEQIYLSCPMVDQIFIYGDSLKSYLLAVVVPNHGMVEQWSTEHQFNFQEELARYNALLEGGNAAQVVSTPFIDKLKSLIRAEISKVALQQRVQPYEVPRDFFIEFNHFTIENQKLTTSAKLSRPTLIASYRDRMNGMFEYHQEREQSTGSMLQLPQSNLDPAQIKAVVYQLIELTVGISQQDLSDSMSFIQLGGDSLLTIRFIAAIHDALGVKVPAAKIMNPTTTVQHLVDHVTTAVLATTAAAATSTTTTSPSAHEQHKKLEIEASSIQLPADVVELISKLQSKEVTPASEIKNILVTGANGFLGKFILLELLSKLEEMPRLDKIYCLVRASNREEGLHRVMEGFDDILVAGEYPTAGNVEANKHKIEVVLGDLSQPRLGLDVVEYERLVAEVDLIVHNGAMVNSVFDYYEHYPANVEGTLNVIRMAVTAKIKSIQFVSTVSALSVSNAKLHNPEALRPTTNAPLRLTENQDVRTLFLSKSTRDGYGTSKWVAECLLLNCRDRGVPVNIFRPSLILGDLRSGYCNITDWFSRLIFNLVRFRVAPKSFYTMVKAGTGPEEDYVTVDFAASVIVRAALMQHSGMMTPPGGVTCHIVNQRVNGDGCNDNVTPFSLDVAVRWLTEDMQLPILIASSYSNFYNKFRRQVKQHHQSGGSTGDTTLSFVSLLPSWKYQRYAVKPVTFASDNLSTIMQTANITQQPLTLEAFAAFVNYMNNQKQKMQLTRAINV